MIEPRKRVGSRRTEGIGDRIVQFPVQARGGGRLVVSGSPGGEDLSIRQQRRVQLNTRLTHRRPELPRRRGRGEIDDLCRSRPRIASAKDHHAGPVAVCGCQWQHHGRAVAPRYAVIRRRDNRRPRAIRRVEESRAARRAGVEHATVRAEVHARIERRRPAGGVFLAPPGPDRVHLDRRIRAAGFEQPGEGHDAAVTERRHRWVPPAVQHILDVGKQPGHRVEHGIARLAEKRVVPGGSRR